MAKEKQTELEKIVGEKYQPITPIPGVPTRVAERGADAPYGKAPNGRTWRENNIEVFGYPCPRDHFLYGPSDLNPTAVARMWGLEPTLVCRWAREDSWNAEREKRLAVLPVEQGGYVESQALALRKEDWATEKARIGQKLIATLEAEWDAGTTESASPKGDAPKSRKMNGVDRRNYVLAIREATELVDVALGMPSKFAGAFAGATINNNQISATIVEAPAGSTRPALPQSHTIEAEAITTTEVEDAGNPNAGSTNSPAPTEVLFTTGQ